MDVKAIQSRMAEAAADLTYRQVAELTGVHPENVRRYMGGSAPSTEFIAAFCAGFGLSADWLVLGIGPRSAEEALREALRPVPDDELFGAAVRALRRLRPGGLAPPGGPTGPGAL